jgi:hypothetical protein
MGWTSRLENNIGQRSPGGNGSSRYPWFKPSTRHSQHWKIKRLPRRPINARNATLHQHGRPLVEEKSSLLLPTKRVESVQESRCHLASRSLHSTGFKADDRTSGLHKGLSFLLHNMVCDFSLKKLACSLAFLSEIRRGRFQQKLYIEYAVSLDYL